MQKQNHTQKTISNSWAHMAAKSYIDGDENKFRTCLNMQQLSDTDILFALIELNPDIKIIERYLSRINIVFQMKQDRLGFFGSKNSEGDGFLDVALINKCSYETYLLLLSNGAHNLGINNPMILALEMENIEIFKHYLKTSANLTEKKQVFSHLTTLFNQPNLGANHRQKLLSHVVLLHEHGLNYDPSIAKAISNLTNAELALDIIQIMQKPHADVAFFNKSPGMRKIEQFKARREARKIEREKSMHTSYN
jgi:hypothetical protein